jgi:PIN domain nuclease of toxin-antitoxin system
MRYLLDTHVLLWAFDAPEKLSERVREILLDRSVQLLVSIATPWELAIKANAGRLDVAELLANFEGTIVRVGYELLETRVSHAIRAGLLPLHHRDPFDRLMIAQAQELGLPLVSCDEIFDQYEVKRIWR